MNLIRKFTMTDEEWARYAIYKELPTTLDQQFCYGCDEFDVVFKYNSKTFCRGCIDAAITKRLGFQVLTGAAAGAAEPINFKERNFGKYSNKQKR